MLFSIRSLLGFFFSNTNIKNLRTILTILFFFRYINWKKSKKKKKPTNNIDENYCKWHRV